MNNFIIVYMESFSAYDPTTKTGELHAFLTIDISLRSFPFHSAWRTMTHDKSLWSMKRSCSFMMNYEPKMKTENRKQKIAKRKMKTFTPSSSLRMPGKHENANRSEHRRESRRDRDERRRSSSSSPEPAKRSRKRSRSKSPEKKSRAHQRAASPSASPSPKREKYYENKADKSNSRQRSSSRSRTAATDKLVTAMMKLIKDKKPRPSYPEIQARANTIKSDHLKTCGATAVTQANTPLVKIEPTDDGGTPKQETSNEQKKRRKSTKQ